MEDERIETIYDISLDVSLGEEDCDRLEAYALRLLYGNVPRKIARFYRDKIVDLTDGKLEKIFVGDNYIMGRIEDPDGEMRVVEISDLKNSARGKYYRNKEPERHMFYLG
ncbi:hypothetical protein COU62_02850 [Candidatus Pacearchaeota archaeon CG10_big_fil_rev_8_21_14_0_10_35_219]|nr:MAG: hypothetical protein AUJ63_00125 [Candidatus Pacearchaeota archaeon CG1_02_35_32]PIO07634.1 MAG: hypothetical protein COU62_02850 [Candidatus Pacearchaeota archaeon CG10_big_fil_rev_8_21_14_0_10_35_219]PIY81940.1 MAG: hypothetical protein COY79_00045 [Candidatus Pacearchaeota archaeon CG_4_10_14_0_8_um_filter_35_169]PIZ80865.1 MAG: hypothetical protein COY00_00255 [Candidatus Pacearchaeota archaeon CG_4_10_14_0_2_um_filter_35_33]PJA69998.1 MAG: hypothetical protein CO155_02235 [Candidat